MAYHIKLLVSLLWIGVALFILLDRPRLEQLPAWRVLQGAFCFFLLSWMATVLKDAFWGSAWNIVQHLCYLGSSCMLAAWCWAALMRRKKHGRADYR